MIATSAVRAFVACAACLGLLSVASPGRAADPPYALLLRSRSGVVTPEKSKDAQTGGGYIQVTQLEPNLIMVLMRGAAATGSGHKEGQAAMQFDLKQDFEIVPTRIGLRPPRLSLAGWAIGALESTEFEGGSAEQGPACAAVQSAGQPVLNFCLKPHTVAAGQNLLINDRVGPLEATVVPGGYCLQQTFALNSATPKGHCHPGYASVDFDPDPKLDSRWNQVLKPFRAVPHRDFGFRVILRVIEEPPPLVGGLPPEPLPLPEKLPKK